MPTAGRRAKGCRPSWQPKREATFDLSSRRHLKSGDAFEQVSRIRAASGLELIARAYQAELIRGGLCKIGSYEAVLGSYSVYQEVVDI